jgi:6,7-dimethyl-8-ribityllumazine synthase
VLGQGGFGITYLAVQTSLNRNVAIKEFFMKDFCSRDEATFSMSAPSTGSGKLVDQYRKKFIKEAMNLAKLNHPNIISVIEVFEENETVYYVMPYLSKGSLQDYVEKHGALSENIHVKTVPGSFELIYGAHQMTLNDGYDAVIILGAVIRGETPHFDYICQGVTEGIARLNATSNIPVVYGLLTTNDLQQARDRSGGKHGNKGDECAIVAIKMAKF